MSRASSPPKSLECIVFDLDGTLVDSRRDIAMAVDMALAASNLQPLGPDRVAAFVGDGVRVLLERVLAAVGAPGVLLDEVVTRFVEAYREVLLETTRLYPGVLDTLDAAARRAVRLAVVTNKPHAFARAILEGLEILDRFSVVVGGDSLPVRKPDPTPIRHALEACGASPPTSVVVGDGEPDMLAGRAAGVVCVGVTYGFRSRAQLAGAGADAVVDSMDDLIPTLLATGFEFGRQ
jgi:phosphoglycolate phosphatase